MAEEKTEDRRNAFYVNDENRSFIIKLFDEGEDSLSKALGSLEMAKDMIKSSMGKWRAQDTGVKGILVPRPNGKPDFHVK